MDEQQLRDFLKEHLKVRVTTDGDQVKVTLMLNDEEIDSDWDRVESVAQLNRYC